MLNERLAADLKAAMKLGGKEWVSAIRMVRAALKNAEIAKGRELDEAEQIQVLSKEIKKGNESVEEFKKANRPDLLAKEETGIFILQEYLPQQMSKSG